MAKYNKAMKDMDERMITLSNRVMVLELEKEAMAQKIVNMELKTTKVKEDLEGMGKEVESGMEKAKEEVIKDMGKEMKEREERGQNIVVYGLE